MSTYGELASMCLDQLKLVSDDSHFQKEHVLFLLDKFRAFILKKQYNDIKKEIPESNFQTVCLDLEQVDAFEGDTCGGKGYLRSKQEIPNMLPIGGTKVSTMDYFQSRLSYVSRERFKYVGNNKYLKNTIYSTIGPDSHLYLKSNNPQAYHLCKAKVTGIFEDGAKAAELSCDDNSTEDTCDVMDKNFPIEEALIPVIIESIVTLLSGTVYKPKDSENNASDDLDRIANYLARNLKKGWERDGGSSTISGL